MPVRAGCCGDGNTNTFRATAGRGDIYTGTANTHPSYASRPYTYHRENTVADRRRHHAGASHRRGQRRRADVEAIFGEADFESPVRVDDEGQPSFFVSYEWDASTFFHNDEAVHDFIVDYVLVSERAVVDAVRLRIPRDQELQVNDVLSAFGEPEYVYRILEADSVVYILAYLEQGIEVIVCWPYCREGEGIHEARLHRFSLFEPMSAADYAREHMWARSGRTASRSWDYLWQWYGPDNQ